MAIRFFFATPFYGGYAELVPLCAVRPPRAGSQTPQEPAEHLAAKELGRYDSNQEPLGPRRGVFSPAFCRRQAYGGFAYFLAIAFGIGR